MDGRVRGEGDRVRKPSGWWGSVLKAVRGR